MVSRRACLAALLSAVVGITGGCLSGDSPGAPDRQSSETTEPANRTDDRTTDNTTTTEESDTDTPTEDRTPPPTDGSGPRLVIDNGTSESRAVTLDVDPEDGPAVSNSWTVEPTSSVEEEEYPPLDDPASVTVSTEGYDPVSYDWVGAGRTLFVVVRTDGIDVRTLVS
jgi:hypothetical protein